MRILMVTPDPGNGGGVATSSARIQSSLQARGHRVLRMFPEAHRFPGDDLFEDSCWRHAPVPINARVDLIERELRRSGADAVVGFYGGPSSVAAVAAARNLGIRSLVALRGNDIDRDFLRPEPHALVRWSIERADAVVTVSHEAAHKVRTWCDRPAVVVGNGVDREFFQPVSGEAFRAKHKLGDRVFGMFGELKAKRGLEVLQPLALAGWSLLLVGSVRRDVEHLVPRDTVVVSWLEREALPQAYAAVDVVGQPSWHDGLPNVVLEAMACARPVVARPVGGLKDVLRHGENGFLTQDDWPRVCEQALLSDVGAEARASVPTVEQEADRWEAVLQAG